MKVSVNSVTVMPQSLLLLFVLIFSAASLTINLDPVTLKTAFIQPANLFHEKFLNTTS